MSRGPDPGQWAFIRKDYPDMGASTWSAAGAPAMRPPADTETDILSVFALLERPEWHSRAACRTEGAKLLGLFFPETGADVKPAKRICAHCPVIDACRSAAEEHREPAGIWAGMAPRRRLRGYELRSAGRSLTDDEAMEARRAYREEFASANELAARFGVSGDTVRKALTGRSHAHLPGVVKLRHGAQAHVSSEQVEQIREIRRLADEGVTYRVLADRYRMSRRAIRAIHMRQTWDEID